MTWLEVVESDLLPRYGEPRIRPGGEALRVCVDGDWCRRWSWIWFPGGRVTHYFGVDHYDEDARYNVRAGHHDPDGRADVSFWRKGEPSASQVRAVLSLAGLLDPVPLPGEIGESS